MRLPARLLIDCALVLLVNGCNWIWPFSEGRADGGSSSDGRMLVQDAARSERGVLADGGPASDAVRKDTLHADGASTIPTKCQAGEQMWCSSSQYSLWGLVDCETGTWKTKIDEGQTVLDCLELSDLRVPATPCACYYPSRFNPRCCERPSCVLPPGTSGQICPRSSAKLCDYCVDDSSCTVPGAKCVQAAAGERFCGQGCTRAEDCSGAADYDCVEVTVTGGGTSWQCVPKDGSCAW